MVEQEGRWSPRFRILLISLVVLGTAVATIVSAVLVREIDEGWRLSSILLWLLVGIVVVISGVAVNLLPKVVVTIWQRPTAANIGAFDALRRLGQILRRPPKLVGIALVAALLVAIGLVVRPEPTGLEPGELVLMAPFGDDPGDARTVLVDQWNRLHPENRVMFDFAAGEPDQQHERMVTDAKPDGANRADVYALDIIWMMEFVDQGYIRELDRKRFFDVDFKEKPLSTCRFHGKFWALPFVSNAGMIYYRADIPGVVAPTSWNDYFGPEAATVVAQARATDDTIEAANAAQLVDAEMLTISALEAIWAAGGNVVGPNGQVLMRPDGTALEFTQADLRGIQRLAAAVHDPSLVLAADDEVYSTAEQEAVAAFSDGRTLFMRNWPAAYDEVDRQAKFDVALAAPPSATALGGQNLAISRNTDKPRAAQALLEFLTSQSSQLILSDVGGFAPTRQSVFDTSKRPYMAELESAINNARIRPVVQNYTEFSKVFRTGIRRALNNGGKLEPGFARELARVVNNG